MSTLLLHATFVVAVLGSKLILALWVIYYLFPADRTCPDCDAETLPLCMARSQRLWGALLFLGKVRRRWCPDCTWEGSVRSTAGRTRRLPVSAPLPDSARRPTVS